MEKIRVSKTLLNDYEDYAEGKGCGIQFREMSWLKRFRFSTPAMKKGQRFEYFAIGTKPGGEIPGEILTDTGNVSKTEELRAKTQANKFAESLDFYGIDIIETDKKIVLDFDDYTLVMIADYIGTWRGGRKVIGDLKYSGLLYNKWEETGWDAEKLPFRRKLLTQPVIYLYIAKWLDGVIPDFLFHVHSSTNDVDSEIFEINLNRADDTFQYLEDRIQACIDGIHSSEEYGWEPRPSVRKCLECPVLDCKHRMKIPSINGIFIG